MHTEHVDTRSTTHNDTPRNRTAPGDEKHTATGPFAQTSKTTSHDNNTKTCTLDECKRSSLLTTRHAFNTPNVNIENLIRQCNLKLVQLAKLLAKQTSVLQPIRKFAQHLGFGFLVCIGLFGPVRQQFLLHL